jgi:hypothetical protein
VNQLRTPHRGCGSVESYTTTTKSKKNSMNPKTKYRNTSDRNTTRKGIVISTGGVQYKKKKAKSKIQFSKKKIHYLSEYG